MTRQTIDVKVAAKMLGMSADAVRCTMKNDKRLNRRPARLPIGYVMEMNGETTRFRYIISKQMLMDFLKLREWPEE